MPVRIEGIRHAGHRVDEVLKGPIKSKTLFPVLLLHMVKAKPDHGYGLMQRIDALCGGLVAVNTNKIYPLLRRLETVPQAQPAVVLPFADLEPLSAPHVALGAPHLAVRQRALR